MSHRCRAGHVRQITCGRGDLPVRITGHCRHGTGFSWTVTPRKTAGDGSHDQAKGRVPAASQPAGISGKTGELPGRQGGPIIGIVTPPECERPETT